MAEAEQAERAFRFTVQGLSPNTGYRYELQSRNLQSEVVNSYTGFFVTTDVMAVPLLEDGADFVKFLRDGQVLIQRGDVVYDLRGQIVNE